MDSPANQDDRQLEQLSEVLLDSDLSPSDSEAADAMAGGGGGGNGAGERKRVRFADQLEEKEGQTANPSESVSHYCMCVVPCMWLGNWHNFL